jgi:NADH-quinone oxidoreductase subunit C
MSEARGEPATDTAAGPTAGATGGTGAEATTAVTGDAGAGPASDGPLAADLPRVRAVTGEEVLFCPRERYRALLEAAKARGFELLEDLCAVDYLTHPGRSLPEGVAFERFEVVVALLSLAEARRVRIRVQVPESDPVVDSAFDVYPGAEAMEREAYDLFGIVFRGHPDLTRILMPEDWEGHPLRKDYGVGRVPVQFKEAPGPR